MIVALAGRRIDEEQADAPRFPLQNVPLVKKRLKNLFKNINVKALVCGAACGADLIALDIAGELGLMRRIVLPTEPKEFRETSVIDRPGDWGAIFDKVHQTLKKTKDVIVINSKAKDDVLYLEANKRIFKETFTFAEECIDSKPKELQTNLKKNIITVIVWEGVSRGKNDITEDFANIGLSYGLEVIEILTK